MSGGEEFGDAKSGFLIEKGEDRAEGGRQDEVGIGYGVWIGAKEVLGEVFPLVIGDDDVVCGDV